MGKRRKMNRSITRMITLLARKSQGCIAETLKKYNLTAAEQPFFMAVTYNEGKTQEELTAMVCVDKAATTRALRSLEEKGFVYRIQDRTDRRQNLLYPTEKARRLLPAVQAELLALNARITQGLGEEEQKNVYRALKLMQQNFENMRGSK